MKFEMFKKIFNPFFYLIFLMFAGCDLIHSEGYDEQAEKWIQSVLKQEKKDYQVPIKEKFSGASHVCFQGSYIFQEEFEKLVNKKLPQFEYQGDSNIVVWWIFYPSRKSSWFKVPRRLADISPGTSTCIDLEKNVISIHCEKKCIYKG